MIGTHIEVIVGTISFLVALAGFILCIILFLTLGRVDWNILKENTFQDIHFLTKNWTLLFASGAYFAAYELIRLFNLWEPIGIQVFASALRLISISCLAVLVFRWYQMVKKSVVDAEKHV